jgi:hypothetical protein
MQARINHAHLTKRTPLGARGSIALLGLTPSNGWAILRPIHPASLEEETRAVATQTCTVRPVQEVGLIDEVLPWQDLLPRA